MAALTGTEVLEATTDILTEMSQMLKQRSWMVSFANSEASTLATGIASLKRVVFQVYSQNASARLFLSCAPYADVSLTSTGIANIYTPGMISGAISGVLTAYGYGIG
jgi:hypothetical protein